MDNVERFVGSYISITTKENVIFEGYIHAVNQKNHEIILEKVLNKTEKKKVKGLMHFLGNQIGNLEIHRDVEKLQNFDSIPKKKVNKEKLNFKDSSDNAPALLSENYHIDPESFLNGIEDYADNEETTKLNEPPPFVWIKGIAQDFSQAIENIQSKRVISVMCVGPKISRFGSISLIIIGTRTEVYIFDLSLHKNDYFINGLSSILEDINILKVVHDARMVSDCLYRVYNTNLRNVFDTQVAHAMIHLEKWGRLPGEVISLSGCVEEYLKIKSTECDSEQLLKKKLKMNPSFWREGLFSKEGELFNSLAKSAMFLRELRTVMLEKLLAEFLHGVNTYLSCVRDKSDNAVKYEINTDKYPKEFEELQKCKSQRKMRHKNRRIDHLRQNNKETDSQSDSDGSNHRSEWDSGLEFSDRYKQRYGEIIECPNNGPPILNTKKSLLKSSKGDEELQETIKSASNKKKDDVIKKDESDAKLLDVNAKSFSPIPNFDSINISADTPMQFGIGFDEFNKDNTYNATTLPEPSLNISIEEFPTLQDSYQSDTFSNTSSCESDGIFYSSVNNNKSASQLSKFGSDFYNGNWSNQVHRTSDEPSSAQTIVVDDEIVIDKKEKNSRPILGDAAKRLIKRNLEPNNRFAKEKDVQITKTVSPIQQTVPANPSLNMSADFNTQKHKEIIKTVSPSNAPFRTSPVSPPRKTFGRGHLLKKQSELAKNMGPQRGNEPPSPAGFGIGMSKSFDFPSDQDLLDTPQITKMISGKDLPGTQVNVFQKTL